MDKFEIKNLWSYAASHALSCYIYTVYLVTDPDSRAVVLVALTALLQIYVSVDTYK